MENGTMEITEEEFMRIQTEIVELKTEVYETKLREENLQKQLDKALKSASASQEKEKSSSFFSTSFFGGDEAEKPKITPPSPSPEKPPPPQSPSKAEQQAEKEVVRLKGIVSRQNNQTIKLNAEVRVLRAKVLAKKEKAKKSDGEEEGGEKEEKVDDLESLGIEVSDALVAELNEQKKKCAKYVRQIEELKKKASEAEDAPEPAPKSEPEPTSEPTPPSEELKQHLESLQKQLSQAIDELQVAKEDRNVILTSVAEKDLQMNTLRDQVTEAESSFKEEKKKTDNLRKIVRELRSSVQTQDSEGSLHEIEEQMKKNAQLQENLTEVEKELQETIHEKTQIQEERDNIKARYQQDIQLLSEQSEQQQTKDKETQDILKEKTDEHERQIVELKAAHFRALEANQEEHVEQLESNKQCYKGEIEHLKGEFKEKEEDFKKQMKGEIEHLKGEFKEKEEDLKKRIEGLKDEFKVKEKSFKKQIKELTFYEQQHSAVKNLIREADAERLKSQNEMKEVQEKLETIEKDLSKKVELAEEEKQKLVDELNSLKESHSNEIAELNTVKQEEISRLEEELTTLRGDFEKKEKELNAEIEEFKKEIKNHRKQIIVNEKKSKNLIKELQSQIQKEKSIRERKVPVVVVPQIPVRRNPEAELVKKVVKKEPSEGERPSEKARADQARPPIAPPKRSLEDKGKAQLQKEVLHLSKVLGDLQGKLFEMEESNRFLKENMGVLKTEMDKKEKIIQEYLVKMKTSRAAVETQKPNFSSTYLLDHVVSHFTGEVTLNQEVYSKTLSALEETMLQNIQLRKDMEHLGNEVERYGDENKVLKLKLRDITPEGGKSEGKMKEKKVNSE